jgi:tetratricopeptide (TPR) repeat protein
MLTGKLNIFNRECGMRQNAVRLILATAMLVSAAREADAQSPALARFDSLVIAGDVAQAAQVLNTEASSGAQGFPFLWRQSRLRLLQGDAAVAQSRQQDRLYQAALQSAEQAIKANPAAAEGYVRRAAASGKVALFSGVLDASDYVLQAKADAEMVIGMRNADASSLATAHYILGRTHLKLTETPRPLRMPLGLGFGNIPEAVTNLRRARELRPRFVMFELEYARALIADDKAADARPLLEALATLPNGEPGDDDRKAEAAALLRSLR